MKRLLDIELQKLWKNRSSKILIIAYFVLLSFIALIASIKINFGPFNFRFADEGIFNFPYIWHFNAWVAGWTKIFLAIIIVSMMANEYSYGTLKQNLIDGMSKKEFILSKLLTVIFFSVISTFFIFIISLILGYTFSSYNEIGIVFSDLEYLLAYFVKLVGFFSFCLFLGILVKRSAFALGFLFFWFVFETVLLYKVEIPSILGKLLPIESMWNLIKEPITRLSVIKTVGTQLGIENTKDYSVHYYEILIVFLWTVIFVLMSYKILEKRDL